MNLADITPLVLTLDEAPNISRCLERLVWAERVVVVDSHSADSTPDLVRGFGNAELHERRFDDHTSQWNHGLGLARTEWVLSLDADYMLTQAFIAEMRDLKPAPDVDALFAPFRYCIEGRPLRASLYPPRAVLFRRDRCRYEQDGHTQLLHIPGRTLHLASPIDHDDRKPLSRWFASQDKYAKLEAEKLSLADPASLRLQDRLRLWIVCAPVLTLIYTLVVKRTLFDGWPGWFYAYQRTLAELMLSLRLLERRIKT